MITVDDDALLLHTAPMAIDCKQNDGTNTHPLPQSETSNINYSDLKYPAQNQTFGAVCDS